MFQLAEEYTVQVKINVVEMLMGIATSHPFSKWDMYIDTGMMESMSCFVILHNFTQLREQNK